MQARARDLNIVSVERVYRKGLPEEEEEYDIEMEAREKNNINNSGNQVLTRSIPKEEGGTCETRWGQQETTNNLG